MVNFDGSVYLFDDLIPIEGKSIIVSLKTKVTHPNEIMKAIVATKATTNLKKIFSDGTITCPTFNYFVIGV